MKLRHVSKIFQLQVLNRLKIILGMLKILASIVSKGDKELSRESIPLKNAILKLDEGEEHSFELFYSPSTPSSSLYALHSLLCRDPK